MMRKPSLRGISLSKVTMLRKGRTLVPWLNCASSVSSIAYAAQINLSLELKIVSCQFLPLPILGNTVSSIHAHQHVILHQINES